MKLTKLLTYISLAAALTAVQAPGADKDKSSEKAPEQEKKAVWLTDFETATKKAAELDQPILADFTGSDWCIWCIRLDEQVLSEKAFKDFAKDNLVLFKADFPQRKKQDEDVKKQNQELLKKYGVRGFPTVLLLDAKGKVLARTG